MRRITSFTCLQGELIEPFKGSIKFQTDHLNLKSGIFTSIKSS